MSQSQQNKNSNNENFSQQNQQLKQEEFKQSSQQVKHEQPQNSQEPNQQSQQQQQQQQQQLQNSNNYQPQNEYEKLDWGVQDQYLEVLKKEIEQNSAVISPILDLTVLEEEYINNPPFLAKIRYLMQNTKYKKYRQVRRDGSCFYRAYLFKIFEHILENNDMKLSEQMITFIKQSKDDMLKLGIDDFIIDDFQSVILEKFQQIQNKQLLLIDDIINMNTDSEISPRLLMYMRMLTSTYVKTNSFLYEGFIDQGMTINDFCQKEIDIIDKEADQIQILALVQYMNIPIEIIYLDSNFQEGKPQSLVIPEDYPKDKVFIHFLYRPGHYDILYTK